MSSQYQQELQALKASACPKCGGGGRIDDAEPGDTYHNEWQCGTCKGSGFAPRPTQETGDSPVPCQECGYLIRDHIHTAEGARCPTLNR